MPKLLPSPVPRPSCAACAARQAALFGIALRPRAAKALLGLLLLSMGAAGAQTLAGYSGSHGITGMSGMSGGPLGASSNPSAPPPGRSVLRLDWRQLRPHDFVMLSAVAAVPAYGHELAWNKPPSKINIEFKLIKSSWGLEQGSLGLRFDTGYRLSLKTRRGGAMLYLRAQF
jgi:hypothetical protein